MEVNMQIYVERYPLWDKKGRLKYAEIVDRFGDFHFENSNISCPLCGRHLRTHVYEHPIRIKISNTRFPDCLNLMAPFIVSERFVDLYSKSNLKGIYFFDKIDEVTANYNKANKIPPNYYVADVMVDTKLHIDRNQSSFTYLKCEANKTHCELCELPGGMSSSNHKIVLKMEDWSGLDVFKIMELGNLTFYSQRFVDFIRENQLTNFWIEPIETYQSGADYMWQDKTQFEIV